MGIILAKVRAVQPKRQTVSSLITEFLEKGGLDELRGLQRHLDSWRISCVHLLKTYFGEVLPRNRILGEYLYQMLKLLDQVFLTIETLIIIMCNQLREGQRHSHSGWGLSQYTSGFVLGLASMNRQLKPVLCYLNNADGQDIEPFSDFCLAFSSLMDFLLHWLSNAMSRIKNQSEKGYDTTVDDKQNRNSCCRRSLERRIKRLEVAVGKFLWEGQQLLEKYKTPLYYLRF